jgi:hypothetical protein
VPLEQHDFVAAIEYADFGSTDLIGAVEEPDQAITEVAAFVAVQRPLARPGERHSRRFGCHSKWIRLADLLQRRPAPARHMRLVDELQPECGVRVHSRGRSVGQQRIGLGLVFAASVLAEEHEGGPGRPTRRRRGEVAVAVGYG